MSAKILDGRELSQKILDELKTKIGKLDARIQLAIILVGDNPASATYVKQKQKTGREIGINVQIYKYPQKITEEELKTQINKLNNNKEITGTIIQLPLPNHIDTKTVLDTISPQKDVDVLGSASLIKLKKGTSPIMPPTVAGIVGLLEEYKINPKNKKVVIVGYGRLVGMPAEIVFKKLGSRVEVVRSTTKNKEQEIKTADIVISGVGKPNLIRASMIKSGAVVIDAGVSIKHRTSDIEHTAKILGDVSGDVRDVAGYITPVPGGVGPMTVAMLFDNLIKIN